MFSRVFELTHRSPTGRVVMGEPVIDLVDPRQASFTTSL